VKFAIKKIMNPLGGRKCIKAEEGLTLVEIMVSMMIFLVISVGVAGTLITGLRTTVNTRLATMGKDVAQQRIEEMRSRVYYVPYSADPNVGTINDIDLLDKYYPDLNTSSQTDAEGWSGRYYSGSNAHYTKVSPADSQGIVTTVETWFVDSNRNVVSPPSSYNSNIADSDKPPSELVQVKITTSWSDRSGENSYVLDSLISSTGQSPSDVAGCVHASNSRVDVIGLILTASTGTDDPFIALVNGKLGEAHAEAAYGCTPTIQANATGGQMSIVGGSTYTGATVSVSGPPEVHQTVGPTSVGPPATWPKPTISNTYVKGEVEDESGSMEVEAEGEAMVGTQSLQLSEVSGTPTDTVSGYKRWDFLNPTITVSGSGRGDDGEDIEAEIEQEHGETEGKAEINYQTINILPLQKWPTDTTTNPSAAQGIVFIRDFHADANAIANGTPGGASGSLTYSFTLGMFNPNKSGCSSYSTGDTCYDMYSISPSTPIQTAVPLSNANYRLQNELMTEWYSYTAADISNAKYTSADGKNSAITVDALVKISAAYGTEIRWNNDSNAITLVAPQGLQKAWIGAIDISVEQNG
jgi:type II secretory pathway pseudopilin PulG